jgi:hypothetical protein
MEDVAMTEKDESATLSEEVGQQLEKDIEKDDPRPAKAEDDGSASEAAKDYQEG